MASSISEKIQQYVVSSMGNSTRPTNVAPPSANLAVEAAKYSWNQEVHDLIDALQKPPPKITAEYIDLVERICNSLLARVDNPIAAVLQSSGNSWGDGSFPEQQVDGYMTKSINSPSFILSDPDSYSDARNHLNGMRNKIFQLINNINGFVARAKNAGYSPPENPFTLAMSFNEGRVGFTPVLVLDDVALRILKGVNDYLILYAAEQTGQLNFNTAVNSSAQISSARFSLQGFGGTVDATVDLAKLLPSADEVKAQKALDALSVFDFSKRIPKILFTCEYAPDGVNRGILIGWKKVGDAAGYIIKRRNIFDSSERTYGLTNADIEEQNRRFGEYARAWIMTFYDSVDPNSICLYLDADISPNSYYLYNLQSFQLQNGSPGEMFNVEITPFNISQSLKMKIRAQLEALDPNDPSFQGTYPDTISPYPVIAQNILGDSKYDWLLAALNIRNSINRRDPRAETRSYSYLSAQLDFLFSQADAGKFVVPKGRQVAPLISKISDAIAQFGVGQVVKEILQETGALYYFEGKDANDNSLFTNVSSEQNVGSLVATIAASIDPETATLNLNTLASNLPVLMQGGVVATANTLQPKARTSNVDAGVSEIEIPNSDIVDDVNSADEIRFLRTLGNIGDGIVDLTNVDGIASFMRVLRIFSDIGPNRGKPISNNPPVIVPDPVTLPGSGVPPSPDRPVAPPAPEGSTGTRREGTPPPPVSTSAGYVSSNTGTLTQETVDQLKKNLKDGTTDVSKNRR